MDSRKTHDNDIHIVETLIGVFAVSDDASILEKGLYPNDPKQIAAALERQSSGEVTKETAELMEKLMILLGRFQKNIMWRPRLYAVQCLLGV